MKKFVFIIFAVFIVGIADLFKKSTLPDHSLFFIEGTSIYDAMLGDRSFLWKLKGKEICAISFMVVDHIQSLKDKIKTGEYVIHSRESVFSFIKSLFEGRLITRKLTIPEGHTAKMIVEIVAQNPFLIGKIESIPQEASLFPSTYFYKFGDSKEGMIKMMETKMNKIKNKFKQNNKTKFTIEHLIILASIIEKESGNASERGLISSVFHNRLAKKMRLQSCPTVIYALSDGYGKIGRELTKEDLFFDSPYNTYRKNGLPPTAICCPGEEAIEAALNPAKSDFLFFVANSSNTAHLFSKNFDSHKRNKYARKTENQHVDDD
ncbi:aminodeoxychorismate lyase [Alphaproteobacteria bacterium]|nr:aminodeoxychorismate lyase [Alphaproteobacteria bacterium]